MISKSREIVCPRKIGPYVLMGSIGRGSFSDVKAAVDTRTGEACACKVISKRRLIEANLTLSFEREIAALCRLNHPSIIQMHDYLSDALNHYVILELFSHQNLCEKIVKGGPLSGERAVSIFVQIADAVKCLHDNGLAHRDLKTENVLINDDDVIKLIDFGFARDQSDVNPMRTHCGTMAYTAPECFYADSYNGIMADIWSLGVVLYSMMTGAFPWTKMTGPALMHEIIHGTFHVPGRVPTACADLIYAMMKKKPEERITIDQVLESEFLKDAKLPPRSDLPKKHFKINSSTSCVQHPRDRINGRHLLEMTGRLSRGRLKAQVSDIPERRSTLKVMIPRPFSANGALWSD